MATGFVVTKQSLTRIVGEPDAWTVTVSDPGTALECVAVHPDRPDRVFLGSLKEGVYLSEDSGRSFELLASDELLDQPVTSLCLDPRDPDHLLVGTEPSSIIESHDGGASWTTIDGLTGVPSASEWFFPPRPETHHVRWLEIDRSASDRWYVGIEAGALVVTPDGGDTWIDRPAGSRRDNHTLATHDDAPDRVYSAAGDGYAESHDRGETWTQPQDGLDHRYVWSVAVDPDDPETRLISAAAGARQAHWHERAASYVYRRRGAEPWEPLDTLPVGSGVTRPVLASGAAPGEFLAASNHGLYRSTDAGTSWNALPVEVPREGTIRSLEWIAAS